MKELLSIEDPIAGLLGAWSAGLNLGSALLRIALIVALAASIGCERSSKRHSAGLRTFPIVALASCGFVVLAIEVLGERSPGQARILEGLITGIGFIGGGAILKAGSTTHGTATAASILNTGIVGGAVGFGFYDIGFVLALANFLVLVILGRLKPDGDNKPGGAEG